MEYFTTVLLLITSVLFLSGAPVTHGEEVMGGAPGGAGKFHLKLLEQGIKKNHHGRGDLLEEVRKVINSHPRILEVVDLDDAEDMFDGNSKRVDDYGHSRFGKRNEFDDYGHWRYGKKK